MEALNTQLLQFFDKLLWISIQSSVLIVLIVLLQKVLRGRLGIRWHYLLWFLLLIRLAMPWLPESKISIFNLVPKSVQQGHLIESISQPRSGRGMDFYLYDESADIQEAQRKEGGFKAVFVGFVRKLPQLWFIGVLIMAGFVCVRNISLWLTVKRERPITDQEILDLFEDCKMEMDVQTIIGVVVSDKIKSPALFGFVRPRLLLPQGLLETYGLEELRYVFIHELAHLRQRDIYFGWLMALLQIAHWFNPLMWFAFRRMRVDRELACDGLAISMIGEDEPPRYGQTILNLLENFSQVRYVPSVAGILEDKSHIERRINMIAKFKKSSRKRWAGAILLLAALACVVLTDAYIAKADFVFGTPMNIGPAVNSNKSEFGLSISADGLSLFFDSDRPDGGAYNIYVATRDTTSDDWGNYVKLGPAVNSATTEACPSISSDGLELFFSGLDWQGSRTEFGGSDLWVTRRASVDGDWSMAENLGPIVNSSAHDSEPCISADGLSLYFYSERPGGPSGYDIWVTTRKNKDDSWTEPIPLGPMVNDGGAWSPNISANGLVLIFCSDRPGGYGRHDLWMTRRPSKNEPWEPPINLGPTINTSAHELVSCFSRDGSTLYFTSGRSPKSGSFDIWQVSILPVVDFNADGFVDSLDVCLMVDNWLTDEPLYDIAPMPFGDGIVDVKDLVLLAEHLTPKEVDPNEPDVP